MSILSAPYFHNEEAAYEFVESRIWPRGPVCPHCGGVERNRKLQGKSTRIGVYKCYDCRKPFTVKIGTIFEASHIPIRVWLQAIFLVASSKKGVSSNQLHRMLGVTLKSAWFMSHRIREAMRSGDLAPFGADGGAVEVDETFIGHDKTIKPKGEKKGRGYHHKNKVLALVDRNSGQARSVVIDDTKASTMVPIVRANVAREARLMTDEYATYTLVGREFAQHGIVRHMLGEYGRGDIHTNTIEGFFSIFKRGMKGVYQHCGHNHLHRYLAEFDFRYNKPCRPGRQRFRAGRTAVAGCEGQAANLPNDCCLSVAGEKGKERRRKAKPDDPAQSARFVEAAKQLGVDETGEAFRRALDTLLPPKARTRKKR